jgi:putative ABC transport system permease protein
MTFWGLILIAFDSLLRNKARAFLTMLGIIIGVASVIVMLAIGQGSKQSIRNQISGMGSNLIMVMPGGQFRGGVQMGNSSSRALDLADVAALSARAKNISHISPEVRANGQVINGNRNTPTSIYGVSPQYLKIKNLTVKTGRSFTEKEVRSVAKVCVLGQTVIENVFGEKEVPIGSVIRFNKIPLRIIGILAEKGQNNFGMDQDDLILAPYTTVQKRMLAITTIQGIYMSAISEDKSPDAEKEIESILRSTHDLKTGEENDFEVRSQEELIKTLGSVSDVLTVLLGAIAGISLVVGGIGIMNIMYVSVTERTREIGLRISIGAKRVHIMRQFLMESFVISMIGGLIGIVTGTSSSAVVEWLMNWPTEISLSSIVLSFGVCSMVGIFFGWYPAKKAARLDPIEALRYE